MPALQIRDLPVEVHRLLTERARREHRSITQQATVLLTEALVANERRRAVLAKLSRSRKKFDFAQIGAPEDLIRTDRNR
jgi:plasmid stability protein